MKKSSIKWQTFWRTDGFVALLVLLLVFTLHSATDFLGTLERRFYDFASTHSARQPSDRIAIIAIDDQSVSNLGRWPWPRDVHAQLIDKLVAAKVKTIAYTVFFFEPQTDRGLVFIRKIKSALGPVSNAGLSEPLKRLISEAELSLDTDAKLAASMARAGNVLIPSLFVLGEPQGRPDGSLPTFALKSTIADKQHFSLPSVAGQQPIALIGTSAAGVAHLNQIQDSDGTVRREPLLINYDGLAVPSMSLLAAAKSLNLGLSDLQIESGHSLKLGKKIIPVDESALMLPQFYKGKEGRPAFTVDSFYDVISGKIAASKYANKIVIVGATAAGVGTHFSTPAGPSLSPAETIAHITSSILNEHFIVQPVWSTWATFGAFLLVAAYMIFALPKLSAAHAALSTAVLFITFVGLEFGLLSLSAIWLKLVFPASLLAMGYITLTTKRFLVSEAGKRKSDDESAETNRMMGLTFQNQGQLDMAFDRFRRVPFSEVLLENLNNLALDFERKRQFNKAQAVYEYMASYDNSPLIQTKINRARNLSETVMLGGSGQHPGGNLLLSDGAVEKPMLGRYQIEQELAKGSMGVVYLGKDPKIGRIVAIKTLALGKEFEGEELEYARQRFFREAETAGRLQHHGIVTIFDAGEEHDLAYIAMEFLKGQDLTHVCRSGHLLPIAQVLSIVARVAEALAYAHRQNVVHRDIKPANIMYDSSTDTVKVTDFGIARITDTSKTKTGFVLGTPSFMSPEQLGGHKADAQSDLYSLGVMLFQMLSGLLPFRGESMAELIYKIANEEAPDVGQIRRGLPSGLAAIVARALAKNPQERYSNGDQLAAELRAVITRMTSTGTAALAQPSPTEAAADWDGPSLFEETTAHRLPSSPTLKTDTEKQ